ncbi:hypothetical protein Ms3S1_03150 [Methylosinus sp. 3S-1]
MRNKRFLVATIVGLILSGWNFTIPTRGSGHEWFAMSMAFGQACVPPVWEPDCLPMIDVGGAQVNVGENSGNPSDLFAWWWGGASATGSAAADSERRVAT